MVNIISRSSWGARAPKNRQTVAWSARQEVTLHYSTGSTSQTPRQIQDFHMGPSRGWSDIAYNFLVDKDGKVYEGRGWLVVGAHAAPRNTQGIGVCYIGSDGMTDAAKRAVVALYDEACRRAGRTLSRRGHRDINSTSCPGSSNHAWWKASSFRSVGHGTTPTPPPASGGGPSPTGAETGMVGLKQGDKGERVKYLQELLVGGGFSVGTHGIDGDYGPATSRAVLAARKSQGSKQDFGDRVTGAAGKQILTAFIQKVAK